MPNIIVMYHYVRDGGKMRGFTPERFRRQVEDIKTRYTILSLTEMLNDRGERPTCVLTFDDGLKDAVDHILPILRDLNVKGVFFIPTAVLDRRTVVNVQKRHLLLSELGSQATIAELNERLPPHLRIAEDPAMTAAAVAAGYLDDPLTCCMKWMLDNLDPQTIEPVLDDIFRKYFGPEDGVCPSLYLDAEDVALLLSEGMEVGGHGHRHRQLGQLYFRDQEAEIALSTGLIRELITDRPLYLSYPSGSYSPLTIRLLQKYGYAAALTVKKHANTGTTPPFELGRYDCIDYPV